MNLETFHFLRPEWLWSLLLLIPFGWSLVRRVRSAGPWERVCDPHLLPHLVAQTRGGGLRWPLLLVTIGWTGAALALAGPAWERLPQQTFREPNRSVFVLGLGDSMNGRDVRPSRIARARHKLLDAVDRASAGSMALVVVREEAFAVTPLTDDANVLREVIPLLDTKLMPGRAVRPARGIDEALRLLEPVGARGARIVLVSDGSDDDPDATETAVRAAVDAGARVSVLGVAGDDDALVALARSGGGTFAALAIDDGDLERVLAGRDAADPLSGAVLAESEIRADEWKDMGAWLLWIPLALAPFAFRRGWAGAVLALLLFQFAPAPARADALDLFQRPDQRGARAFEEGHFSESAQHFEDPSWQAAARYRAGDFAGAAEALAAQTDSTSLYNLGNALAKTGELEGAIAAYDRALAVAPNDEDARFNRDLVKKLLEAQPPPQSKDGDSDSKGDSSDPQQDPKQDSANSQDDSKQDGSADQQKDSKAGEGSEQPDSKGAQQDGQQESKPSDQAEEQPGDAGDRHDEASAGDEAERDAAQHQAQQDPAEAGDPHDGDSRSAEAADPADPGEEADDGESPALRSGPHSGEDQQRAQWMARLPDDPGGLLRERIRRDYLRKRAERRGGGQ